MPSIAVDGVVIATHFPDRGFSAAEAAPLLRLPRHEANQFLIRMHRAGKLARERKHHQYVYRLQPQSAAIAK